MAEININIIISVLFMLAGVAGIFVSGLPGTILVFIGIAYYSWTTNFTIISIRLLILFGILTIISMALDYLSAIISVKRLGITQKGMWGMILGGVLGFFIFNVLGMVAGQFLGIVAGELISGKKLWSSIKAGGISIIGYFAGMVINIITVAVMLGYLIYRVLSIG